MNPQRRGRGFTLVEIVVALAILVLLGAIAVPGYSARTDRERLNAAAEALAADINEARFEAARQGRPLHVRAQGGPAWCWSVAVAPDCPCGSGQACQLRSARERDHPGVLLQTQGAVELGAHGRATSAGSNFDLESPRGLRLRVAVGSMGRAHVCTLRGDAVRYPPCS